MSTEGRHPPKQQHLYRRICIQFYWFQPTFDWHKYLDGAWRILISVQIYQLTDPRRPRRGVTERKGHIIDRLQKAAYGRENHERGRSRPEVIVVRPLYRLVKMYLTMQKFGLLLSQ